MYYTVAVQLSHAITTFVIMHQCNNYTRLEWSSFCSIYLLFQNNRTTVLSNDIQYKLLFIYCQWYYHIATGRCPGTRHLPSTYTSTSHTPSPDRGSATRHASVRGTTLNNTSNNYVFVLFDTCKYIFPHFTGAIFIVVSNHLLAYIVVVPRMSKQILCICNSFSHCYVLLSKWKAQLKCQTYPSEPAASYVCSADSAQFTFVWKQEVIKQQCNIFTHAWF